MKRATQRDVARAAGVSQAAVSMVLSGGTSPSISEETYQRITRAAEELGYRKKVSTEKARRLLGFSPRPWQEAVTAAAESLLAAGA